jgi:hypothetical protein
MCGNTLSTEVAIAAMLWLAYIPNSHRRQNGEMQIHTPQSTPIQQPLIQIKLAAFECPDRDEEGEFVVGGIGEREGAHGGDVGFDGFDVGEVCGVAGDEGFDGLDRGAGGHCVDLNLEIRSREVLGMRTVRENGKKGGVWGIKGLDAGDTRSLASVNKRMLDI